MAPTIWLKAVHSPMSKMTSTARQWKGLRGEATDAPLNVIRRILH